MKCYTKTNKELSAGNILNSLAQTQAIWDSRISKRQLYGKSCYHSWKSDKIECIKQNPSINGSSKYDKNKLDSFDLNSLRIFSLESIDYMNQIKPFIWCNHRYLYKYNRCLRHISIYWFYFNLCILKWSSGIVRWHL